MKEVRSALSFKRVVISLILMLWPFIYFMFQRNNYSFRDRLDVFTFMLEGVLPLAFVILAALVYLGVFAGEIKNRFIVYTRMRFPLRKLLRIKFAANFLLTWGTFFVFTFGYFLFSFYISPLFGLVDYHPELYKLNEVTVVQESYTRHTFTQLLQYGSLTYGFLYSGWVALNAAVFASLGFFMVLIMRNQFAAISFPFLLYILGSFITSSANMKAFRFPDAIFPFSSVQMPIWTACVPLAFLTFLCMALYVHATKNLERNGNLA
ncbi:hypothetical protein [Paenibacillus sp. FJAT-26967]|uniref:hypothetical protein n=1 Tax=Paenibacillus sp. FJAT-26967 TaxID=1729690 RepID=UPI000838D634|nr:hypothetical protein [Paenibacillus sp. FJAT-26967]